MSLLAIPEPATVDLDRARELAASIVSWAEECDDLTALEDARAKVAAIETYLRRRGEAVAAEIATADRRLEVRIGALLGPARPVGRPPAEETSAHGHLPRQRAAEFRQMAEHQDVPEVADAINNGASRRKVLGRIRDHELDQELTAQDEWAATLPTGTPESHAADRHRNAVWDALSAIDEAAQRLAAFTPAEVAGAIDGTPAVLEHVAKQMAAHLTNAVNTLAPYEEVTRRWN